MSSSTGSKFLGDQKLRSQSNDLLRCELGHEWLASPAARTRHKTGCPYCGNDIALTGFNDLGTTHPAISNQAFEWDPTTVVSGSHKVRKWKCELGHVYSTPIYQRALYGGACHYCSGHKTLPGYRWKLCKI